MRHLSHLRAFWVVWLAGLLASAAAVASGGPSQPTPVVKTFGDGRTTLFFENVSHSDDLIVRARQVSGKWVLPMPGPLDARTSAAQGGISVDLAVPEGERRVVWLVEVLKPAVGDKATILARSFVWIYPRNYLASEWASRSLYFGKGTEPLRRVCEAQKLKGVSLESHSARPDFRGIWFVLAPEKGKEPALHDLGSGQTAVCFTFDAARHGQDTKTARGGRIIFCDARQLPQIATSAELQASIVTRCDAATPTKSATTAQSSLLSLNNH